MARKIYAWLDAVESSDLNHITKHVLHVLSRYFYRDDSTVFPTHETLSKKCGISKSSIIRAIKEAEDRGFIRKDKKWKMNVYVFVSMEETSGVTQTLDNAHQVSHRHLSGVTQTLDQVSHRHPNNINRNIERSSSNDHRFFFKEIWEEDKATGHPFANGLCELAEDRGFIGFQPTSEVDKFVKYNTENKGARLRLTRDGWRDKFKDWINNERKESL